MYVNSLLFTLPELISSAALANCSSFEFWLAANAINLNTRPSLSCSSCSLASGVRSGSFNLLLTTLSLSAKVLYPLQPLRTSSLTVSTDLVTTDSSTPRALANSLISLVVRSISVGSAFWLLSNSILALRLE